MASSAPRYADAPPSLGKLAKAKARAGILKEFTGISDPYEEPTDAELHINTADLSPEESAQEIILHLEREGFIGKNRNHA